jgi:hypothetical protein
MFYKLRMPNRHDINDRIGNPPVRPFSEDHSDTLDKFEDDWCGYAYSALLRDAGKGEDDGAAAAGTRRQAAAIIELERDEYGLPIVPPRRSMKSGDLDVLIRSFLTIHYRSSCLLR